MLADATNDTDNRASVEEIYESATNTSNLKQEAERRTSADVLRDMAMSTDRLGAALLRLRAQWESSVRPERQQPRSVKQFMALHGDNLAKAEAAHRAERIQCDLSYEGALAALANRLADLDGVRDGLTPYVVKWGWGKPVDPVERSERTERRKRDEEMLAHMRAAVVDASDDEERAAAQATLNHWLGEVARQRAQEDADDRNRALAKIGPVIRYWLDQNCTGCDGTRWELVPGTNRQGTRVCPVCKGSGYLQVGRGLDGQDVRRLANFMDQHARAQWQKQSARRAAMQALPLAQRIPRAMRHGQNPKGKPIDPEAD